MKIKVLFILVLLSLTLIKSYGQILLNHNRESVKNWSVGFCKVNDLKATIQDSIIKIRKQNYCLNARCTETKIVFDTISNIKIIIEGKEKLIVDCFFDTTSNRCDSTTIKYFCNECVNYHIKQILDSKKWKNFEENKYIYKKILDKSVFTEKGEPRLVIKGYPVMTIKKTEEEPLCTIVSVYVVRKRKAKWKDFFKNLRSNKL